MMTNFTDQLIQRYGADNLPEYPGNYVRQIASTAGRMDGDIIMLSVEDNLSVPDKDGRVKTPPLGSSSLSRYVIILNGKGNAVQANLPADEVHALAQRCRAVTQSRIMRTVLGIGGPGADDVPVKIFMGKFKGKTPEEVLLENPNNYQELINTANMLCQNLDNPANARYREGNSRQIEAIRRAVDKFNRGELKTAVSTCIDVYPGEWKNKNKKLEDGRYEVYRLNIRCHITGRSPWELTIEEGVAPVAFQENNMRTIQLKQLQRTNMKHIFMGENWENIIEKMDSLLSAFEHGVYLEQKAYVEANTYHYKKNKKRKHPEYNNVAQPEYGGYVQEGYPPQYQQESFPYENQRYGEYEYGGYNQSICQ